MAQCISITSVGTVVLQNDSPSECPGYVLLSAPEYVVIRFQKGVFDMPNAEDAATAFFAPFIVIVFFYLVARASGAVVNMFR